MRRNMSEESRVHGPLVSVCIPAYNAADYILETIRCVLGQSYKDIELIVVDDASSDNTLEVLRTIDDERLYIYSNDKNLGMAGNWNKCLSLCHGQYVKLICADDLLHKRLIELEVAIMNKYPEVNLVESDTRFVDMHGQFKGYYKRFYKSGVVDGARVCRFSLFTRDYLGAPLANMIRREAIDRLGGFDENIYYIIDYDFFMKIAMSGKIYIVHKALNYFRIRGDSNTGQVLGGDKGASYIDEHRYLAEKYAPALGLAGWQVELSVLIRRITGILGGIYLKIFLPK